MSICWSNTSSSEPCLKWKNCAWREVAVVVVVVIQGCDRGNRRQRDSLWLRIHTHASLICDQAGRQSTSVEHVQSCFLLHREAFLRLLLHFIALSHLQHTKQTYNIRVPTLRRERALFMRVCIDVHCLCTQKSDSGEIKRKSKPVRVRTGCFQHRIPQHQLAGCAATGSYWSWSGPAGGSKHTSSPGLYEIRWRVTVCHRLNYRSWPVPGPWHASAAISYLRL